jgi:hypothetical protein
MLYDALTRVRVLPGSRVKLTEEQAFNARHLVALPAGDGFRNVLHPFDFKPGARFEFDGDLPKNLAAPVVEQSQQSEQVPAVKRVRKPAQEA